MPHDLPPYVLPARLFLGQDDLSVSPAKLVSLYRNHSLCELGSSNGVTLVHKGNKTRIQVQAPADLTLANARAYMPLGSRWDGNVRPASLSLPGFVCPRPLILFSEIRSHSRHALPFTGPATIHFRIRELACSGVLEAITEGKLVWVLHHSWYDNFLSPLLLEMNIVCIKVSVVVPSETPLFSLSLFHLGAPF